VKRDRILGRTGMKIAPVVYGGVVSMNDGQEDSDRYVAYAIEKGTNYFDIAPSYGDAQEKLGNSLKPYRNEVYLACKTQHRQRAAARKEMEDSLRMLHTEHFDVYQLHALKSVDEVETAFGKDGVMEATVRAKEEGLVRFLGITCHSEDAALKALSLHEFDTVLFPMNWGLHMGKGFGDRLFTLAKEKRFGLLAMKSMIHRSWRSREERDESGFPKSWCKPIIDDERFAVAAIKYALSLGADAIVPPGNFTHFRFAVEHIDECLEAPLGQQDVKYLQRELEDIDGLHFL
jgi:aryl-alcohol dehydrogenase-like predicted oxidoreductase